MSAIQFALLIQEKKKRNYTQALQSEHAVAIIPHVHILDNKKPLQKQVTLYTYSCLTAKWPRESRDLHENVATSPFQVFTNSLAARQTGGLASSTESEGWFSI